MENRPVIWSAASCEFPGAGVYLGLGQDYEHFVVARALNPRQMRMYVGGRMRPSPDVAPCPVVYYAVRDPSAVRVEPVQEPPVRRGFRHYRLHFRFDPRNRAGVLVARNTTPERTAPVGFILTIGLRTTDEDQFYHATIDDHQDQDWGDLFGRIQNLGQESPGPRK